MAKVHYPQNDFTRMIERTAQGNASGIRGVASATPLPTVRSNDLGRPVEAEPEMTADVRAELDRLAIEAGVKDERLGNVGQAEQAGNYATMEEAIAAGASVHQPAANDPPIERVPAGTRGAAQEAVLRGQAVPGRQTAREYIARQPEAPRLPDFRRVEGIDLIRSRVMIDGMEFPISDDDARGFKEYVVETARAAILAKLEEAVGLFATPETAEDTNGGEAAQESASEEVQQQHEGGSAEPAV